MTDPVKVFGTYLDAADRPLTGSVTFTPDVYAPDDTPGTALKTQQAVVARLDKDGYFEVLLTASDDDGWRTDDSIPYRVDERIPGLERQRLVFILTPGPVDINTQPDVPLDYTGPVEVPVPGVPGPAGPPNSLAIGTVTTGAPGSAASASITGTPPAQTLNLGIPAGNTGATGPAGSAGAAGTPGAPGAPGGTGPAGAAATVTAGATVTTAPGTNAAVTNVGTSSAAVLDFQIPRGAVGATGAAGGAGSQGPAGIQGPQGTPATVTAGTTTTGAPGSQAAVTNGGTASNAIFNFQIPRGDVGPTGPTSTVPGPVGPTGPTGAQGIPGDLSQAKADTLYEPKSELLKEAAWYVDAGVIGTGNDRLLDITGRGRDAVFGAGAAAPVVLPWSGEDYIYTHAPNSPQNVVSAPGVLLPTVSRLTFEVTQVVDLTSTYLYGGETTASLNIYRALGGTIGAWVGGTAAVTWAAAAPLGVRVKLEFVTTATTIELFVDGVSKGVKTLGGTWAPAAQSLLVFCEGARFYKFSANATHILDPRNVSADYSTIANTGSAGGNWTITRAATGYKTAVVDRPLLLFGGGQWAQALGLKDTTKGDFTALVAGRHFFVNGQGASYGGLLANSDWQNGFAIFRSGQTVQIIHQVDSGGVQVTPSTTSTSGQGAFGTRVKNGLVTTFYNGAAKTTGTGPATRAAAGRDTTIGNLSALDGPGEFEFVAAAIFDRALTDAEIAEVSLDLAGVPHDKQPDPHPQYALEAGIGNLLTENQASGTDTLGTAQGFYVNPVYGTLASVISWAAQGSRSVEFTIGGASYPVMQVQSMNGAAGAEVRVTAGQAYTFCARTDMSGLTGANAANHRAYIDWYTDANTAVGGSTVVVPSGGEFRSTVVAPATATKVTFRFGFNTGSALVGEKVRFDSIGVWKGAGGDSWQMPGTPITGLGYQVTHPNTDDVLAQVWDTGLGRWQTVHYDSGVRNVASLLLNGWTGSVSLRRVNMTCFLTAQGINHPTAPTAIFLDLNGFVAGFNAAVYGIVHYRNTSTGAITNGRAGRVESALPAAGQSVTGEYIYAVANPVIPASLPGTLQSAAPAFYLPGSI